MLRNPTMTGTYVLYMGDLPVVAPEKGYTENDYDPKINHKGYHLLNTTVETTRGKKYVEAGNFTHMSGSTGVSRLCFQRFLPRTILSPVLFVCALRSRSRPADSGSQQHQKTSGWISR